MFNHPGNRIKTWGKAVFWIETIACIILAFVLGTYRAYYYGDWSIKLTSLFWLFLLVGPLVAYLSGLLIYGLGELIENSSQMNESMQLSMSEEIAARKAKLEEEQKQAEELEAARIAAEEQERNQIYNAFWSRHSSERDILEKKKSELEALVDNGSGLALKERDEFRQLLNAINGELDKQRANVNENIDIDFEKLEKYDFNTIVARSVKRKKRIRLLIVLVIVICAGVFGFVKINENIRRNQYYSPDIAKENYHYIYYTLEHSRVKLSRSIRVYKDGIMFISYYKPDIPGAVNEIAVFKGKEYLGQFTFAHGTGYTFAPVTAISSDLQKSIESDYDCYKNNEKNFVEISSEQVGY